MKFILSTIRTFIHAIHISRESEAIERIRRNEWKLENFTARKNTLTFKD